MKSIKVFAGGVRLKDVYPYATRWQVIKYKAARIIRGATVLAIFVVFSGAMVKAGSLLYPIEVHGQDVPYRVEVAIEPEMPVLDRIAVCESGNSQTKNGQVLIKTNSNGSVDVGRYQINSVWNAQATKLGLDVTVEKDNIAFAKWLYANRGTEPWYSSKACWSK